MRAPRFWGQTGAWQAYVLAPLCLLYEAGRRLRCFFTTPSVAGKPVICIGNLTVGGSGKTPVVRALARRAKALGLRAAVATRGYGGHASGPLHVDPVFHTSEQVGDEALLLAQDLTVWKATDRVLGALAAGVDNDVVLLDDGKQNPAILKTATFVVVDEGAGFGNGWVLPAGPLREPVQSGLQQANAIILIADPAGQKANGLDQILSRSGLPIIPAHIKVITDISVLSTVEMLAGIGRPEKFRSTLETMGLSISREYVFADHHPYTEHELNQIIVNAKNPVVTTEKDFMRIPSAMRSHFTPIIIEMTFDDSTAVDQLLKRAVGKD